MNNMVNWQYIGGVVGVVGDSIIIKDSKNYGNMTLIAPGNSVYCAGIAGYADSTLSGVINYGEIYAEGAEPWVGGIAGDFSGTTMEKCYNLGNIKVVSAPKESGYSCLFVGGLLGWTGADSISECYNKGNLEIVDSKIQSDKLWAYVRRSIR